MLNQLLETIIQILTGWVDKFTSHAQHVEDKLDSLDQTASDIETNTEPISNIKDNTGAVITPIQNIKSNTDSIAQSSQTSANNTTAILNNISTLSANTGRAAAYAQDCANNTLEIKDKITTIASDTTQLRADSANIAADVSSINQAIGYYVANTLVTEDSEGEICNIDTDIEDYLQKFKVNIPADQTGFSGITITRTGKNLLAKPISYYSAQLENLNECFFLKKGAYTLNLGTVSGATKWRLSMIIKDKNGNNLLDNAHNPNIGMQSATNRWRYGNDTNTTTYPITAATDCYVRFCIELGDTTSSTTLSNSQLELGSTATDYEPYKAMTYPVSFGSTITDGAEADLLSGLVKVNTTPESFIQIQPIAVRTYKGVNNIYSDIGNSALTYRETLKHYLDKNNQ